MVLFTLFIWIPFVIFLSKKFGYKNVWIGTVVILLILFLLGSLKACI